MNIFKKLFPQKFSQKQISALWELYQACYPLIRDCDISKKEHQDIINQIEMTMYKCHLEFNEKKDLSLSKEPIKSWTCDDQDNLESHFCNILTDDEKDYDYSLEKIEPLNPGVGFDDIN